jgi:hypothetical protein
LAYQLPIFIVRNQSPRVLGYDISNRTYISKSVPFTCSRFTQKLKMATPLTRSTSTSVSNLAEKGQFNGSETPSPGTPDADPEKGSLDIENLEADPTIPSRPYSGFKWFAVCIAVYSTAFLYGLDNTIVADIQGAAVETFGSVEKLGWLGIGFPLGSIATILSIGKAYSIFDVKWIYVTSIIMFEAGSALCGAAPSMNALIIGRVWAGAGGAGIVSCLGLPNGCSC